MRRSFSILHKGQGVEATSPSPALESTAWTTFWTPGKKVFNIEQIISMLKELLLPSYPLNPVIIFVLISLGRSKDYGRDHSPGTAQQVFEWGGGG